MQDRRAASDVNRLMGLKIKTEPSVHRTLVSSTSFGTPASPAKARASFGRQMPFFIGVAGKGQHYPPLASIEQVTPLKVR